MAAHPTHCHGPISLGLPAALRDHRGKPWMRRQTSAMMTALKNTENSVIRAAATMRHPCLRNVSKSLAIERLVNAIMGVARARKFTLLTAARISLEKGMPG